MTILMNIYLSSFLYSLSDKSDNFEKTKSFNNIFKITSACGGDIAALCVYINIQ